MMMDWSVVDSAFSLTIALPERLLGVGHVGSPAVAAVAAPSETPLFAPAPAQAQATVTVVDSMDRDQKLDDRLNAVLASNNTSACPPWMPEMFAPPPPPPSQHQQHQQHQNQNTSGYVCPLDDTNHGHVYLQSRGFGELGNSAARFTLHVPVHTKQKETVQITLQSIYHRARARIARANQTHKKSPSSTMPVTTTRSHPQESTIVRGVTNTCTSVNEMLTATPLASKRRRVRSQSQNKAGAQSSTSTSTGNQSQGIVCELQVDLDRLRTMSFAQLDRSRSRDGIHVAFHEVFLSRQTLMVSTH